MTMEIVIAVLSVLALFAMAYAVRKIGAAWESSAETQRKAVHVGVGVHAMLLPAFLGRPGFLVFAALAGVALLILRMPKVARDGVGASIHSVARRSWGDLFFLLAVVVLFLRSPGDPALYTIPIAVLTLSDAAAAIIGTEYGRMRFGAGDRIKSVEGSITFFVVTWITVVTILIIATDAPRQNVVWLATLVAAFSSLVEADSWRGLDNLFVPVGIHVLLSTWGASSPTALAVETVFWGGLVVSANHVAPYFKLTPHALRVAFVSFFLTAALVGPLYAVLPVFAYGTQLLARRSLSQTPGDHDLDFVSLVVLVGVVWLILGAEFVRSGIEFYTVTFGSIAVGYLLLSSPDDKTLLRLSLAIGGVLAVGAIQFAISRGAGATASWTPRSHMIALGLSAPFVTGVMVFFLPGWFRKPTPALRLGAASLILPVLAYLYEAFA
ncbi:MAG: diacylglycerol/polyprenol kinase family protein [Roseiarcus sp.]